MTEEKKKFNKMCLTGFIFSVLPAVLGLVLGILALNAHDNLDVTLAYIFAKGNGAIGIMKTLKSRMVYV